MKKRTFVKPGVRRPFPGGVLIEERGEMGATACTMDSYRSIIQRVLLGMALGAAYLLSGCATGSGVYGIPVQGERIVFVLGSSFQDFKLLSLQASGTGQRSQGYFLISPVQARIAQILHGTASTGGGGRGSRHGMFGDSIPA
jgi:hypothetical protein